MTAGTLAVTADDAEKDDGNYIVPGLERGLKILAEFSPREPVLGAPELSKRLKIPRTTVFRLLQTLESLGFLERADKDRNYRLGVAGSRPAYPRSLAHLDRAHESHPDSRWPRRRVRGEGPEPGADLQFGEG